MPHLRALTGLRFVAAVLVVVHHFGPYVPTAPASDPLRMLKIIERNVLFTGMIGVDLFFILSGFILTYSYVDASGRLRGTRRGFWIARVARIYPIYLCAWALAALPFFWHHSPQVGAVLTALSSLALVQTWLPFFSTDWNPPAWSLSDEALFYLLFPVLPVLITRLNRYQLYLALAGLWITSLAMPLTYLAVRPAGSVWMALVSNPVFSLPEFLTGMALGRLYVLGRATTSTAGARRRVRPGYLSALALLGCGAIMVVAPWSFGPLYHVAVVPFFALLIYSLVRQDSHLAAALSRPTVLRLGEASYALYILHWPLWDWLTHVIPAPAPDDVARLPYFLSYLGLLVGLSLLAQRVVEQPARRAIRRAFRHHAPSGALSNPGQALERVA